MPELFSVAGRIALVTGGTSGIGLMIARGLVEHGARTYLVGRNAETCSAVAENLAEGGECRPLPGDLSTVVGAGAIAQALAAREERLDILVNNAGALREAPLDAFPEEAWDEVVDLNLKAAFFLTQKVLPLLRRGATSARPSTVINIGSVGGLRVGPRETYSYAASKAGLHHLTHSLARRLGPENITVNALAPGFFPSGMTKITPEVRDTLLAQTPRRRLGEANDIAGAVIYLGSPAAAFVSGVVLPVDGAMSV